ncbi:MAG: hypothetical protein AAGA99_20510 [Actinomycetota bacterium]
MEPAWVAMAAVLVVAAVVTARLTVRLARNAAALRTEVESTRALGPEIDGLRRALERLDDDIERTRSHPALEATAPSATELPPGGST